jgi:acetyltransferase-like isoleucine patch superfamily enzyme
MGNYLKSLYYSISARIYSVGQLEHLKTREKHLRKKMVIAPSAKLYDLAEVDNFSNNPNRISVGANSHIYGSLVVYHYSGEIFIGDNCSVGEYSRIVSSKKVSIGNRVMIAHNVNILDNNSHPIDARLRHEDFINTYSLRMVKYELKEEEISIQDDVWIGFNSIILKGVTIGRGAIIGAGSVVTKDVEPWSVNAGNPLQCIYRLDPLNF